MSDDKKYTDINEIDDIELEEIEEDEDEYEEICMMCHRPESKAGRMLHMPGNVCLCDDCMHRTMDIMNDMQESGILDSPEFQQQMAEFERQMFGKSVTDFSKLGNPFQQIPPTPAKEEKKAPVKEAAKTAEGDAVEEESTEEEGQNIPKGFPQIRFINMNDLQGRGMSDKQKLKKKKKKSEPPIQLKDIPAPHKIKAGLDEYVVGQEKAKKAISVAVYNHYKRIATGTQDSIEIEKSNMLMIGPTGSGKTYLVKTLARLLDVPLAIADATSLTEAGYIGDDIESVVSKLLAAADNDVEKAERGIIFIDEIDKIAKKKDTHARDVSGESVQQGMLKLLEGAEIEVPVGANSKNAMVPLATVNTKNILFICGGAFPDLENIIKERLTSKASIGFGAELKDAYDNDPDILSKVTIEDLRKFGMIPEFLGRLPIICNLKGLDKESLIRILREPKNAILKQYQKLLELDEVQLVFDDEALEAIAEKATKKDIGARALRSIIEEFMLDIMYEIPKDDNIGRVTITRAYIEGTGGPIIEMRGNF
jgi:ATP-dependent Clp protease ATP-binding subunit ClpX